MRSRAIKSIRREIRLSEGDVFDSSKLRRSRQRLGNLGFFEEVKLDTRRRPEEDLVDLEVRVKEQPTGAFTAGAGYSSTQSVIGTASIRQNNLFGRGQRLALTAALSQYQRRFHAEFHRTVLSGYVSIALGMEAYNRSFDYDIVRLPGDRRRHCVSAALSASISASVSATAMKDIDITDIAEDAPQTHPRSGWAQHEQCRHPVARPGILAIMRSIRRRGFYNLLSVDFAGGPLGAENKFYKTVGETNWYYPLFSDVVLSLRGRLGYADGYDGQELPLYERFFVGTQAVTIRGYQLDEVGPTDINGDPMGGNSMILLSGQLRFPITQGLSLVGFIDIGQSV